MRSLYLVNMYARISHNLWESDTAGRSDIPCLRSSEWTDQNQIRPKTNSAKITLITKSGEFPERLEPLHLRFKSSNDCSVGHQRPFRKWQPCKQMPERASWPSVEKGHETAEQK
jgi:hypothetical protein